MDLNKQKDAIEKINTGFRVKNLVTGIGMSLVLIAMSIFFIAMMPGSGLPYILLTGGVAFIIISIAIFVRQSHKPTAAEDAAHNKVTYANFTTDSVAYAAPKGTSTVAGTEHGAVRAWLAPAMPTGIVSVNVLGKTTYTKQENALLLTNDALIGIQIPPTSEATSDSVIGSILSALPTEASTKNILTSSFDRASLRETVEAEVATNSVEVLMQKYYSFVIPFSEIIGVEFHRVGGIHVKTQTLGTFQWLSGFHEDEKFLEAMKLAGLPVTL
jgi:hypothetical protein